MSVMNIELALHNMIENQLRAGGVRSQEVLELFSIVRRDRFVPSVYEHLAFAEIEVPLPLGENMLTPLTEGLILQAAAIRPRDRVLEIGTGSGFMAALLAQKAQHVISVEIEPSLKALAESNLAKAGIVNVDVVLGNGAEGWAAHDKKPYDVIVISGSLPKLPDNFLSQLAPSGRLTAFIGESVFQHAQLVRRSSNDQFETTTLFETAVKPLREQTLSARFQF